MKVLSFSFLLLYSIHYTPFLSGESSSPNDSNLAKELEEICLCYKYRNTMPLLNEEESVTEEAFLKYITAQKRELYKRINDLLSNSNQESLKILIEGFIKCRRWIVYSEDKELLQEGIAQSSSSKSCIELLKILSKEERAAKESFYEYINSLNKKEA